MLIHQILLKGLWLVNKTLEKVPSGLNSLKHEVDKLDVDKLKPVSVNFKKVMWYSR